MKKRKQIIVLILALVVLAASIFFIARRINTKNQENIAVKNLTAEQKAARAELFSRAVMKSGGEIPIDIVMGSVGVIGEKTLTIKLPQDSIVVNISDITPIMLIGTKAGNEAVIGKIADIKVGDPVRVTYDKASKDAKLISVTKIPVSVKTK